MSQFRALTFDLFGTVLDLGGSLTPYIRDFLKEKKCECLMVSAHPFDVVGARACGFRGAFVNRYGFPYIDDRFLPDLEVPDFSELARELGSVLDS